MRIITTSIIVLAAAFAPTLRHAASAPVSDAFRRNEARMGKILVAAAQEMPADKYGYKPTPAQMSFGEVVLHVAGDNDEACPPIAGMKAPARPTLSPTDDKAKLIARLQESFDFCSQSIAHLDDANLDAQASAFGTTWTKPALMMERIEDWADHYSQFAIYLRLNGLLPPTARS
jgi:hypothetical protein